MAIGGGILKSVKVPKALKFRWKPWKPVPLEGSREYFVLSDEDFEKMAVRFGRKRTDDAFTVLPTLGKPVIYFRDNRRSTGLFTHELRHVTEGHFHD